MAQPPEDATFFSRWSRRKRAAEAALPPEPGPEAEAAPGDDGVAAQGESLSPEALAALPSLDELTVGSDIRAFMQKLEGADTALFFYAGHGLQVNGINYLAPTDSRLSDESDLEFEALRLEFILGPMEKKAKTSIVFS